MSITLCIEEKPQPTPITYYIEARCFMDNDGNHELEPFLQFLEDKKFKVIKYTWTTKKGEYADDSLAEGQRLHWHCHLISTRDEEWTEKRPIQQSFKSWWKSKGIPYACRAFQASIFIKLKTDETQFLQYPLKCQEVLTEEMYHGMTKEEAEKYRIGGTSIFQKKQEYLGKKRLKENSRKSTWNKLIDFVKDKCEQDPRWIDLIQTSEEIDLSVEIKVWEPLGIVKNIKMALNILLPYIVDYYVQHEDCNLPYNIDKLGIKFLLVNKLVSSFQVAELLSKY